MRELVKELKKYDPQLILWQDPRDKSWYILRQPESHGSVPYDSYTDWEILSRLRKGGLIYVYRLEHEPGMWVLEWLKARDTWNRRGPKEIVQDMDYKNEQKLAKVREEPYEVLRNKIREDWKHIRDELRGDTIRRKWTVSTA